MLCYSHNGCGLFKTSWIVRFKVSHLSPTIQAKSSIDSFILLKFIKRKTKVFNIRIEKSQEVINYITEYCKAKRIKNAAIVSIIGAVDSCCISNMPQNDAKEDILTEYNIPFELIGSGEIKNGRVHIHCILGQEGNSAIAGHLHWANVKTWFISAYIIPL